MRTITDPTEVTGPPPLSYTSDQPKAWAAALRHCANLETTIALCDAWGEWVPDAADVARQLDVVSFVDFRNGLLKKTDDPVWAQRYGAIAIPGRLLDLSMLGLRDHAPFGTAAIRVAELSGNDTQYAWLRRLVARFQ